jgi:hypothetical protein
MLQLVQINMRSQELVENVWTENIQHCEILVPIGFDDRIGIGYKRIRMIWDGLERGMWQGFARIGTSFEMLKWEAW